MCGIAGFVHWEKSLCNGEYKKTGEKMAHTLVHRGPDAEGVCVLDRAVLAHARLAVIDPSGGSQPMTRERDGKAYTVVYNGELYNTKEIKRELLRAGAVFSTRSDTEVLLLAYMYFGPGFVHLLNGIYSFAIWDDAKQKLFLCRDRFGVKPFYYTFQDGFFVFGSEIKALFAFPNVEANLDEAGICEIFGIGPAVSPGCGVFKDIYEVMPGYSGYLEQDGLKLSAYFRLHASMHTDSFEETVDTVRYLLCDSIRRQTVADVPLCTFLSGGLDSSMITAIVAGNQAEPLCTYSFDYEGNDKYFKPSDFQPDADTPYIQIMAESFGTEHTVLTQNSESLVKNLYRAVHFKDLPGMADVDSSLLGFLAQVKNKHTVALSGECADEIFGGYPWFFREEMLNCNTFPWCPDVKARAKMLSPQLKNVDVLGYVQAQYERFLSDMPAFPYTNPLDVRRREISYLNIYWFMTTLLTRKDRMSMASGLEVRVPFCDHRLVQYVWNIPWDMQAKNGERKHILREAARGILPESVRSRKKSPYPKTHNPDFERMVKADLAVLISDKNAPLWALADMEYAKSLVAGEFDYGKPWFGQLMAGPQRIAYLLQINEWMKQYKVRVCS
ncbi:MAG: asparagine synthase (glutamine-hydrolyzing) [Clostridia bacterium]|nr:asparagine synthase (glutamine-hydrolyzing) [Clostridia bacterium]